MSAASASTHKYDFDRHTHATPTADPLVWTHVIPTAFNTAKTSVGGYIAALCIRTGYRALLRTVVAGTKPTAATATATAPPATALLADPPVPPNYPYPHPLSASFHYLRMVDSLDTKTSGSVIRIQIVKTSKQSASIQIEFSQSGAVRVVVLAMYGSLTSRPADGWNWEQPNRPPPRVLSAPNPETCTPFRTYPRPGGAESWPYQSTADQNVATLNGERFDCWLRLSEKRPPDVWTLVLACDGLPPPVIFAHMNDRPEKASSTWFGTTVLDCYFHRLPDASADDWLFIETETDRCVSGFAEFHGSVVGRTGKVYASYRQIMQSLDLERWGGSPPPATAAAAAGGAAKSPKSKSAPPPLRSKL